jgi:Cu(I)/Ag(I) efflux system membrane fusion protein
MRTAWLAITLAELLTAFVLTGCRGAAPSEPVRLGDYAILARLAPDPPNVGENRLLLDLKDTQGKPVDGASLDVMVSMPAMGAMPEMRSGGQVTRGGRGLYEVVFTLQMLGDWTVSIRIDAPEHPPADVRLHISPPRKGVVFETRASTGEGGVGQIMEVSPARQQLIGVTWGRAEQRNLAVRIRAAGRIEVDESQLADITLRYPAFVEKLHVSRTGQPVRRGERLLRLYSPELLGAQQDYLQARSRNRPLLAASEERLKSWGFTAMDLAALFERGRAEPRVTLRSPVSGTVLTKNVVEGTRAEIGTALFRIGNLGRVWVLADLSQRDAAVVGTGQAAIMTVPGLPGSIWKGTVSFVYPTVDDRTRALRIRLEFDNAEASLRPGMSADVRIEAPVGERLSVPDSALLRSGEHAYVFVRLGQGRLQPVEVQTGIRSGDFTEVRSGLEPGDEVATAATFLLSSEAQLRDALPRWSTP